MSAIKLKKDWMWLWLLGSGVAILGLWGASPWIVKKWIPVAPYEGSPESPLPAGVFGDQFGAINALFSGWALAFIAISLWYQRRDIQLQQQALLDQKNVFERQLRLAATTEVVASLPAFKFKCSMSASGLKIEVRNVASEIYLLNMFIGESPGWSIKQMSLDNYLGNIPEAVFEIRPTNGQVYKNTISVKVLLTFTIRSGEVVKEPYYVHLKILEVERARPLMDTIQELLNRQLPPYSSLT